MNPLSPRDDHEPILIEAARIFDGDVMRGLGIVEIAAGRIAAIHAPGRAPPGLALHLLPAEAVLAPGLIDVQVNGGGGVLLNDAPGVEAVRSIAAAHRRHGTTGLLPTLITDAPERLAELEACAAQALTVPGVLGFHLEGPLLNPARKGIHPAEHIRAPTPADIAMLSCFAGHGRTVATLAPERLEAGLLERLAATGLRLAIGHSEATAAQLGAAIAHGLTGVTHLFNAMSQMTPREPGIVGLTLADERLFAGLICDGLHVDPVNLQVAFRAKGRDRLMLVTDAMPSLGSAASFFMLHGRRIDLAGGRLTDARGTLAGAHLGMIDAVWNAVAMMGATLEDALIMASRTPARFLGLEAQLGRIAPGYAADLVAFREREVLRTWIGGRS